MLYARLKMDRLAMNTILIQTMMGSMIMYPAQNHLKPFHQSLSAALEIKGCCF